MELELYADERVRVKTSKTLIDVQRIGYDSLGINLNSYDAYIEVRKKGHELKVFQFPKRSYKKENEFGYWKDAEVVFSYNRNGKDNPDLDNPTKNP
jgi:hypothetical protein